MVYKRTTIVTVFSSIFLLVGFILISGCKDNSVSPNQNNFTLSFKTNSTLNKTQGDQLTINSAKILLSDMKLEMGSDSSMMEAAGSMAHSMDDHHDGYEDHELKMGPFVVDLNLSGSVNTIAVNSMPAGTYNSVKFKIHKLRGNENVPDSDFVNGPNRYSIVVKGTYNGNPFEYRSDITAQQKVEFNPPINVQKNSPVNVTLTVDPSQWFMNNNQYINPSDSANAYQINMNIRQSFHSCFEDDDMDGHPDHGMFNN